MKTWRWYSFRRVGFVVLLSLFVLFCGNWVAQHQQIYEQFNQIEQQMNDCQLVAEQSLIDETTIEIKDGFVPFGEYELYSFMYSVRMKGKRNKTYHSYNLFTNQLNYYKIKTNIKGEKRA
ncbi:hypothetical protein IGI96_001726 [Enterococcus sp. DIV0421]|uniref:hypothetical protein n=1 Tax=Enterococcus sp. DIV0421 TaxID=2774688 RepID=UPI003F206AAD